ncbi:MAG: 6-phosphogluconolactonase [Acidobacteria bacterium]|nr:6-phosphogluconolactonase [Acidobacteriota bacterium]
MAATRAMSGVARNDDNAGLGMIRIVPQQSDVAVEAARVFTDCAKAAVAARGRFTVALSGGTTPPMLFRLLAGEGNVSFRASIPWTRVHVFWGDERCVPPTHPMSNYGMAKKTLLDHVPIPDGQIHRIRAEDTDANHAAHAYEATIRESFGAPDNVIPVFDLMLLGMGGDGHTASLFPGSAAIAEHTRLVAAPWVPHLKAHRITLTPPVLLAAETTVVLVSGEDKAAMLQRVLEGRVDPNCYPIQCLRASSGCVTWLVDRDAASHLAAPRLTTNT